MKQTLPFCLLCGFLISACSSAFAPTPTPVSHWLEYTDSKFGFQLQYPASWILHPRADQPGAWGEVLIFEGPPDEAGVAYTIQIGQYSEPIKANESLSDWKDRHDRRAGDPAEPPEIFQRQSIQVNGLESLLIVGRSNLTEFRYTNIRQENTVWFVWSNIGESANDEAKQVYEHLLDTLRFDNAAS